MKHLIVSIVWAFSFCAIESSAIDVPWNGNGTIKNRWEVEGSGTSCCLTIPVYVSQNIPEDVWDGNRGVVYAAMQVAATSVGSASGNKIGFMLDQATCYTAGAISVNAVSADEPSDEPGASAQTGTFGDPTRGIIKNVTITLYLGNTDFDDAVSSPVK